VTVGFGFSVTPGEPRGVGAANSRIVRLHDLLEPLEARRPELRQERLERLEALRPHDVEAALGLRPDRDEPRVLEHLQMLRDRGPAHRELARELADRARSLAEALEDRPARGVAERRPSG
jgi:hypothetical protein